MCTRTLKKYSSNPDLGKDQENIAYIAGLFDGEGCVSCVQRPTKRTDRNGKIYNQWYIRAEIAMTNEETIKWVHHILGMGWSGPKRYHKHNYKPQWRWCCGYRDCLKLAKMLLPYAKVKKDKLQKVINHYDR
jgi:hypothetical protein|tara:strand:+ start:298 stop:693 length:396 start_codon:yes stop_codon:yes gene_type:complete